MFFFARSYAARATVFTMLMDVDLAGLVAGKSRCSMSILPSDPEQGEHNESDFEAETHAGLCIPSSTDAHSATAEMAMLRPIMTY